MSKRVADAGQKQASWFTYRRPKDTRKPLVCFVVRWLDEGTGKWIERRLPRDRVKDEADARRFGAIVVAEARKEAANAPAPTVDTGSKAPTFQKFAESWTDGTLARDYPDHVHVKKSVDDDRARLSIYVYPVIGPLPIDTVTLRDCERVMQSIAKHKRKLTPASRRQIAQTMHRVLKLAVYPGQKIKVNPLPAGFMPRNVSTKALTHLFPDEDARLMGAADTKVPIDMRVFYGTLAREGMREGELLAMRWQDIDLERGAVTVDENKTDDPRSWALDPGVVTTLKLWKKHYHPKAEGDALVFVEPDGGPLKAFGLAIRLRAYLKAAGVDRAVLYERSEVRLPMRVHDLRATFVTVSLANGKTESWVADRTGHKSSVMINRYRRAARSVAEMGLGPLRPLDVAIPEIAALVEAERKQKEKDKPKEPGPTGKQGSRKGSTGTRVPVESGKRSTSRNGSPTSRFTSRVRRAGSEIPNESRVPRGGIEPSTRGFSVRCSTN